MTLQREFWNGNPEQLREAFTLTKRSGARATCSVWSHIFGWEMRLDIDGSIIRTKVTREPGTIESTCEEWRAAMLEKGWQ